MSDVNSLVGSSPSTSCKDLHQETTPSMNLKRSSSNHGLEDNGPKEKKMKTTSSETAGSSRITSELCNQEPSCSRTSGFTVSKDSALVIMNAVEGNHDSNETNPAIINLATADKSDHQTLVCNGKKSKNLNVYDIQDSDDEPTCVVSPATCKSYEDGQYDGNFADGLPSLIMEKFFTQIPFRNLLRTRLVCKYWKAVIDNSKFLMWKKAYHEVRAKRFSSPCWLDAWCYFDKQDVLGVNCFNSLIGFIGKTFDRKPPSDLQTFLSKMRSYDSAKILISQKFRYMPSLSENPWCLLAVIILLSMSVEDLYKSLKPLILEYEYKSTIVSEVLFCIASSLLYLTKRCHISRGIHYRLYNVLHAFENKHSKQPVFSDFPVKVKNLPREPGLHILKARKLTFEQLDIVNHKLGPNQVVRICSFAGTGKTTALAQFTREHVDLKFLYITNIKAVCEFAKSKFPSHVECRTPASLAHDAFGTIYSAKLCEVINSLDILPFLHPWDSFKNHTRYYAESVLLTIRNFCQSADQKMNLSHAVFTFAELRNHLRLYNQSDELSFDKNELLATIILNEAIELWDKLVSPMNMTCKISPEIYLKLFQLRCPSLYNYDCIILDQAEDSNAAVLDLVLSQGIPVILSGDHNQQINMYQNPQNSWLDVEATHTYSLTKSLRFGPEIAYVANCIVGTRNERDCKIIGNLKKAYIDGNIRYQCAIIACKFETIIEEAFRLCCTNERHSYEPQKFKGAFVGGISSNGIDQMIEICKLKYNKPVSGLVDPLITKFDDFSSLEEYAINSDKSLASKVFIVNMFGAECLNKLKTVKDMCSCDLASADIIFSTVRKARGLEFDTVVLASDFHLDAFFEFNRMPSKKNIYTSDGSVFDNTAGRRAICYRHSLVYTALTRARKSLILCEALWQALMRKMANFLFPIEYPGSKEDALHCPACGHISLIDSSSAMTMFLPAITLSNGVTRRGGQVCKQCSEDEWYCTP